MQRHTSALVGSVAVLAVYVLIRSCIYYLFPIETLDEWFLRDTWMTVPRLGAFAALVLLNRKWNVASLNLPLRDAGKAVLLGLVPMALWVFYFSGGEGEGFGRSEIIVGFFTSLAVGLFEEYAFRGPLLSALRERTGLFGSIVLSAALFTVYHVQAQPVRSWLTIFLAGSIFANLRYRGLSLGWLALIHGVIDASFFAFPEGSPDVFGFHGLVLQGGLLLYAVATYPWRGPRR